jgi:hypothetical protein
MPLDTADYDRIQSIVDRALDPIRQDLKLMMPKDESITRHIATSDRIFKAEQTINENKMLINETVKWGMTEHEKQRSLIEAKFKDIESKLDDANTQIDTLQKSVNSQFITFQQQMGQRSATMWQYVAVSAVGIVLGIIAQSLVHIVGK